MVAAWCLGLAAQALSATAPAEPAAVVSAVGDLMIYNWISAPIYQAQRREHPEDVMSRYRYPFEAIKPWLQGVVVGNLEGPLTSHPAVAIRDKTEKFSFATPPRYDRAFQLAGFDVLSVANNHAMDCGPDGLRETLKRLKRVRILAPGGGENEREARAPVLLEDHGLRIAVLAYVLVPPVSIHATATTAGVACADPEGICADVRAAKGRADAVLVMLHWGREVVWEELRTPPAKEREALAHAIIDAGAAAVIGSHSHVVEDIERYKSGVIFYGLGNFVFAGTTKEMHPDSLIARFELTKAGVVRWDVIPVLISPVRAKYRPVLLTGSERDRFLKSLVIRGEPDQEKTRILATARALSATPVDR